MNAQEQELLEALRAALSDLSDWQREAIHGVLASTAEALGHWRTTRDFALTLSLLLSLTVIAGCGLFVLALARFVQHIAVQGFVLAVLWILGWLLLPQWWPQPHSAAAAH